MRNDASPGKTRSRPKATWLCEVTPTPSSRTGLRSGGFILPPVKLAGYVPLPLSGQNDRINLHVQS